MEVRPSLGTASGKLTMAGETAATMRYEYAVGGDTDDLVMLIDKINRQKMSSDFVIVPATYIKNGMVVPSSRPGSILFYCHMQYSFGELHFNGSMTILKGHRAGQTVERYKIVPSQLAARVDELFKRNRPLFDILSLDIRTAYAMGTLGCPDNFKPAEVDLNTGQLKGVVVATDTPMSPEMDADAPESPDDFGEAPF